jgi:hypothetical protein
MQPSPYVRPCKVCLLEHDEEIHAATLSVHNWFHEQVTQGLYDDVEYIEVGEEPIIAISPCVA